MDAYNILVAYTLLAAPHTITETPETLAYVWEMRESIKTIIIQDQIGNKEELVEDSTCGTLFTSEKWVSVDLSITRRRFRDLQDAPKLDAVEQFFCDADALRMFSLAYRNHLELQLCCTNIPTEIQTINAAIRETNESLQVYYLLDQAQTAAFTYNRRMALKKLKELLGDLDFYAGRLPPPVPLWRFREY